jgi:hypothetical protein
MSAWRRGLWLMRMRSSREFSDMKSFASTDEASETWSEIIQCFVATGWEQPVNCPFCERNALSIVDAQLGAHAELRRWIFCDDCGERASIPGIVAN